MEYKDYLQRVVFEDIAARCVYVRLEGVLAEVARRGDYPAGAWRLLSEALLVAGLMSSGLKFSGRISLQIRGEGPLRMLVADCTDGGGLRATASWGEDQALDADGTLETLVGAGAILTLTLDPADQGQRWQGIVPLEGERLGEAVAAYFERSEQLATCFRLAVGDGCAAALMLQRMPGPDEEIDGWNRLQHLLASASDEELLELDGETLTRRLFHAEARRVFPARRLEFDCPCTRDRVTKMLLGLGSEELASMAAEPDPVEVRCQFCNALYRFDALDIEALRYGDRGQAADTIH